MTFTKPRRLSEWTVSVKYNVNQWNIDACNRIVESSPSHAILTHYKQGHKEWWVVVDKADIDLLFQDLPRYAQEVADRSEWDGAQSYY